MADYTISVTLSGDDSSFQQMFNNAQKSVDSFKARTSGVTSGLSSFGAKCTEIGSKLTKSITTPALGAATALGGLTIGKGFKRLTGIDDARAKLKGLGHSAEDVKSIMNNALESVKGTSYGLDAAATTAAGAVAAGVKPGKDLTRYLSLTADAAAEAGISMNDMGSIINKVQTSGVAMSDNLNQLADRGLPIFQWIADEAGVSATAVKDMAAKGQISSELFLNAIEKNIGGAAKTIGEESFTAALANMGASLSRIGANFLNAGDSGKGAFDQLKPLITEITDDLGGIEEKAKEWGEKLGNSVGKVVDKFHELKENFNDLSDQQQGVVKNAAGMGAVFAAGMGPAISGIGKASSALGQFSGVIDSIPSKFQNLGAEVGNVKSKFDEVGSAFKNLGAVAVEPIKALGNTKPFIILKSGLQSLGSKISEVGGAIKGKLGIIKTAFDNFGMKAFNKIDSASGGFFSRFNSKMKTFATNVSQKLGNAFSAVSQFSQKFTSALGPVLKSVGSFAPAFSKGFAIAAVAGVALAGIGLLHDKFGTQIDDMITVATEKGPSIIGRISAGITHKLPDLMSQGATLLTGLVDVIIANLPALLEAGTRIIAMLVRGVALQLPTLMTQAVELITTLFTGLIDNLPMLITAGIQLLLSLVDGLVEALPQLIDSVPVIIDSLVNAIIPLLPTIMTSGITLITSLVTGLINAIPHIVAAMPQIISSIWNALKEVNWKDLGKQVIDGLINGLKSMLSSLKDAAKEVADSIKSKFKDIMGIHSPSKVFFEYGRFTDQGFANGIIQNAYVIEQAYTTVGFNTPDMSSSVGDYGYNEPLNSTPYDGFMDMFKSYSERQAKAIENGLKGAKLIGNNRELGRFVADLGFARA